MSYYLVQKTYTAADGLRDNWTWRVSGPFATSVRAEQAAIAALSSRYTVAVTIADHVSLNALKDREGSKYTGLGYAIDNMRRGESQSPSSPEPVSNEGSLARAKPEKMTTDQMLEHLDAEAPKINHMMVMKELEGRTDPATGEPIGLGVTRERLGVFVQAALDDIHAIIEEEGSGFATASRDRLLAAMMKIGERSDAIVEGRSN